MSSFSSSNNPQIAVSAVAGGGGVPSIFPRPPILAPLSLPHSANTNHPYLAYSPLPPPPPHSNPLSTPTTTYSSLQPSPTFPMYYPPQSHPQYPSSPSPQQYYQHYPQYYMYSPAQSHPYTQHSYLYPQGQQQAQSTVSTSHQPNWKKDKSSFAPAQIFHCEPCEKDFPNEKAYQAHLQTHEKCSHPGCTFQGTKKVVSTHYQLVHGTFSGTGYKMIEVEGMEFKVLMGTDPAEVEEWRNQRRKKFPTKANIEQKERSRQELLHAGGIEKPSPKLPKKRNDLKRPRNEAEATEENDPKRTKESQLTSSDATNADTSIAQDDVGEKNEEAEEGEANDASQTMPDIIRKPVLCRLYLAGKCRKGEKCKYSHNAGENKSTETQPCSYFVKGKCRRGSRCMFSHSMPLTSTSESPSTSQPLSAHPPASLYRKLVDNEIHQEENLILQCIRYIVQENFFESEPTNRTCI